MPVCAPEKTTHEARAYELLIAHARKCRVCRAGGKDLCRKYRSLFLKWEALNR